MPTPVKVPIPSDNSNRVEQQSAAALVDGTLVWAKQGRAGILASCIHLGAPGSARWCSVMVLKLSLCRLVPRCARGNERASSRQSRQALGGLLLPRAVPLGRHGFGAQVYHGTVQCAVCVML